MNRRDFSLKSSAFLGLAGRGVRHLLFHPLSNSGAPLTGPAQRLETVTDHVSIYRDVVNVGIVRKNGKTLLIDSGEASILQAAKELNLGSIDRVLYTHYHRDQCSGAARLKKAGVKIDVPASEAHFFDRATEFWLEADSILDDRMNFRPEIMVLRESVATDRKLQPGEVLNWEGIPIRVLATPGHTAGSLTYLVDVDGKIVAFSGDMIYGPGQIWNFYSLQKGFPGMAADYWGFGGTVSQLLQSANTLLSYQPFLLIPSHGEVIRNPKSSVASLKNQIDNVMTNYFTLTAWRIYARMGLSNFKAGDTAPAVPMFPPLPTVKLPPWLHRIEAGGTSSYIVAEDKSIFLFDCGFPPVVGALDKLVKSGEISGIDAIWITHYHDDHNTSVNAVRRKYGSKVYVQKEMQDIFENPTAYCMPALFVEGIHIDHPLSEGEVIHWKGYKLTAYYFPGQTLYHDGLLVEHDDTRVFMTGDSFANWGIDDYCSYNRNFIGKDGETAGYNRCLKLLLQLKPDLLCAAHWGPEPVSQEHLQKTLDLLHERQKMLANLFPWDDPNFGLDPYWISAYPYRQSILPGQRLTLEARIYNHSDSPRIASAELRAPLGWQVEGGGSAKIPPHTEGKILLTAIAPEHPPLRRQVLGLAVHFDDRNLGEFAEAIVDYLVKTT
jgi:glyoxylase-like metal-dependent hydrolase (beta-lactamase superfamily II)